MISNIISALFTRPKDYYLNVFFRDFYSCITWSAWSAWIRFFYSPKYSWIAANRYGN
jgi:hypothetical protein